MEPIELTLRDELIKELDAHILTLARLTKIGVKNDYTKYLARTINMIAEDLESVPNG